MKRENLILEISMGDLKINSVADKGFYENFNMSPELHAHSYYEILFSVEGGFLLSLADGTCVEIQKENFCLIPPGVYHGTRGAQEDARKLALRFRYAKDSERRREESLFDLFHGTMEACGEVILFSEDRQMADCMELLREELSSPGRASKEYVEAVLSRLYLLLLRRLCDRFGQTKAEKQSKEGDEREQRRLWSEEYFQEYYAQPITEAHMAEKMNLSRRQVSRVLREIYGKSFRQLLIEERLHRAAQLLLTTDQAIEEIAATVGYTSLSGFYSAFRRAFGMSAGQYRREFPKNN